MQKAQRLLQQALQFHRTGKLADAEKLYRQILSHDPQHAEALTLLGALCNEAGRHQEGLELLQRVIAANAAGATTYANLGNSLRGLKRFDEALAAYDKALTLLPRMPGVDHNAGNMLASQQRHAEAIARFRKALEIDPNNGRIRTALATSLLKDFQVAEALELFERGMVPPYPPRLAAIHGEALFKLNYADPADAEAEFRHHRKWAELYAIPLTPPRPAHRGPAGSRASSDPGADRPSSEPLRVGFVSPDFRRHSIRFFMLPLLRHHDRQRCEMHCYADLPGGRDADTDLIESLADRFVVTSALSDEQLAGRIVQDGIDVLVDIAGHTGYNRLLVFARRPAPVQVSYLGYPNTTGLPQIQYRLVDRYTDPEDAPHGEMLVRLPTGFLCYEPLPTAPEVAPPPALRSGGITFGSLNNTAKLTASTLSLWARTVLAVPGSRLLLKLSFHDKDSRADSLRAALQGQGLPLERLEILPWRETSEDHLQTYDQIDIALDTFPYNGTTTTCEALWMGVPVVTLAGQVHRARVGVSVLTAAGFPEWVAASPEEYVGIAQHLAANVSSLAELRKTMRDRLSASALLDAPRFAREFETVLRDLFDRQTAANAAGR